MRKSSVEAKKLIIISKSPKDTRSIGKSLGDILRANDILCLYGDLGSGKTCLTQGIAHGLGILEEEYVRSSTFVLFNEYRGGRIPLYHFDFFRIDKLDEIIDIGFEEYINNNGITVIEWADKFPGILPEKRLDIELLIDNLNTRKILISIPHPDKRYNNIFMSLKKSPRI